MKQSDQLATSFITPFGMYCYVTMPFGLRNAGATYQRCMLHVFGDHLRRNVEVGLTVGRENPRASWASKLMGKDFRTPYGLFR